jgi:uncharacterized protein (TIGR02246 family)
VFITVSGDQLAGCEEIRGGLARLLALEPVVNLRTVQVLSAGETALVIADWSMGTSPSRGTTVREPGSSAAVLRRQRDGDWLISIDHP